MVLFLFCTSVIFLAGIPITALIFKRKPKITWTDCEVMKFSANQESIYKKLDLGGGEKLLFTMEQVAAARQRALDLGSHLPRI